MASNELTYLPMTTLKLQVPACPALSVPVHVTAVTASENKAPERGLHVTSGEGSMLSVAVTGFQKTSSVLVITMLSGQLRVGASSSVLNYE